MLAVALCGCAGSTRSGDVMTGQDARLISVTDGVGIYHTVRKGETVWRIAQTYGVEPEELIRINQLADNAQIEKDQLLFIPGVTETRTVIVDAGTDKRDFIWPADGKVIRFFGREHKGIDMSLPGSSKVRASREGRVVFADYLTGYGYMVIVDHADGYHTVYAGGRKLLTALNVYVFRGQELLDLSNDGRNIFYFQIRKNSVEYNPLHFLPKDI